MKAESDKSDSTDIPLIVRLVNEGDEERKILTLDGKCLPESDLKLADPKVFWRIATVRFNDKSAVALTHPGDIDSCLVAGDRHGLRLAKCSEQDSGSAVIWELDSHRGGMIRQGDGDWMAYGCCNAKNTKVKWNFVKNGKFS